MINRNLATTLRVRNHPDAKDVTDGIEIACTLVFSIELGLRVFASSVDPLRLLLCDIYFWVDVVAIMPNLIEWTDHAIEGNTQALPTYVRNPAALMRMLRILKLMRHYTDWRVLKIAIKRVRSTRSIAPAPLSTPIALARVALLVLCSRVLPNCANPPTRQAARPILVPAFAMVLTILLLSGVLWLAEGDDTSNEPSSGEDGPHDDKFVNSFETMWAVFWLVTTLGFDGYLGDGTVIGRLCIATALVSGLILTTMPITIIGEAFSHAWSKKEIFEIEERTRELLVAKGLSADHINVVFEQFDSSHDGTLDFSEFHAASA